MAKRGLQPHGAFIRRSRRSRADGGDSTFRPTAFAASVGISYQHLANIENGRHRADEVVLRAIAKRLGCSIDEVILASVADVEPGSGAGPKDDRPPTKRGGDAVVGAA